MQAGIAAFQRGQYTHAEHILQDHAQNPEAQFFLSLIHLFDTPSHPDYGLQSLIKLAHEGHNAAMDTLAGLYLHGHHPELPADAFKALRYYEMSAQRGYGPAQFNCGILYKNGENTPQDLEKAYLYLALAAANQEDLHAVCQDAARYRDDVAQILTHAQKQRALYAAKQLQQRIQQRYKTLSPSPYAAQFKKSDL